MYICYLDESGTPDLAGNTGHFVYAGIAVPVEAWKDKDAEISTLKHQYGLGSAEIHTGWINRKYYEQVKVNNFSSFDYSERRMRIEKERIDIMSKLTVTDNKKRIVEFRKYFQKTYPYIHLTYAERKRFIYEVAMIINKWHDTRIFFHSIDKECYDVKESRYGGAYQDSFHQIVTRFQMFLKFKGRSDKKKYYGLLVSDNNESINRKLTRLMREFHKNGAFWRDIDNIIETPLFVDSALTSMIQLADFISYFSRRYFDNNETEVFDLLFPRIDRAREALVGARHYAPGRACACRICEAQGES